MKKVVVKNKFTGGMDCDMDDKNIAQSDLRIAINVDTTEGGKVGGICNIKGTLETDIKDSGDEKSYNILGKYAVTADFDYDCDGVYECKNVPAIIRFVYDSKNKSRIYLQDVFQENEYQIYPNENDDTDLGFPPEGSIDGFWEQDKGSNKFYWTDAKNFNRCIELKWSCAKDFGSCLNDLELRPRGNCDQLTFKEVVDGGFQSAGSKQIAFRYYNSKTCRYSCWSTWTNPIMVANRGCKGNAPEQINGGVVGGKVGRKIVLTLDKSDENKKGWDSIQIAVAKNDDGTLIPQTIADLLSPSKEMYDTCIINYTGQEAADTINVSEISIEDQSLASMATLEKKDERAFGANVKFKDLRYDRGTPEISYAQTIKAPSISPDIILPDPETPIPSHIKPLYANKCEDITSSKRSYWRGEVYRFGVTYSDGCNWSEVCPIDFSKFMRGFLKPDGLELPIQSITDTGEDDTCYVTVPQNIYHLLNPGDWMDINGIVVQVFDYEAIVVGTNVYCKIRVNHCAEIQALTSPPSVIQQLLGDAGNWASKGCDWKFPERCSPGFTILNEQNIPEMIGLFLKGLKNHPSWAKCMCVVRMERKKNIIYQFPQINTAAYQGVTTQGLKFKKGNSDYDKELDTIYVKQHFNGATKNICRIVKESELDQFFDGIPIELPVWRVQYIDETSLKPDDCTGRSKLLYVLSPDYLWNMNGEPYQNYAPAGNEKLHIIDAVQFQRKSKTITKQIANTQNIDEFLTQFHQAILAQGMSRYHKSAVNVFSACEKGQYFYNKFGMHVVDGTRVFGKKIEDVVKNFHIYAGQDIRADKLISLQTSHPFLILPEAPMESGSLGEFSNLLRFGGGSELSMQQGDHPNVRTGWDLYKPGNIPEGGTSFGFPVQNQRSQLVYTAKPIQDFTYNAARDYLLSNTNYFPFSPLIWHQNAYDNNPNMVIFFSQLPYLLDHFYEHLGVHYADNREPNTYASSAAYIFNYCLGLDDDRYGSKDQGGTYCSTGACVRLTPEQIANNTPIDIEVWGGDAYISKMIAKITDSNLLPLSYSVADGGLVDLDIDDDYSGNIGWKTGSYEENVEIIELYIESEVNTALGTETGLYPQKDDGQIGTYRQDYLHPYNPGYSAQNRLKKWQGKDDYCKKDGTCDPSLIVWTDPRIENTEVIGYDRWRQLHQSRVLDEKYGAVTKLLTTSDNRLWAVQERGIAILPIGYTEVETLDGAALTLRSGDIMGTLSSYVSTERGSQHIRTIASNGSWVYAVDELNRDIFRFGPNIGVQSIARGKYLMEKCWKECLAHPYKTKFQKRKDRDLFGFFDECKREYTVVLRNFHPNPIVPNNNVIGSKEWIEAQKSTIYHHPGVIQKIGVYSEKLERWKTHIDIEDSILHAGLSAGQEDLIWWGSNSESPFVVMQSRAYQGERGKFFGKYRDSKFLYISNQEYQDIKQYEVAEIVSNEPIDYMLIHSPMEHREKPDMWSYLDGHKFKWDPRYCNYYHNRIRDCICDADRIRNRCVAIQVVIINDPARSQYGNKRGAVCIQEINFIVGVVK